MDFPQVTGLSELHLYDKWLNNSSKDTAPFQEPVLLEKQDLRPSGRHLREAVIGTLGHILLSWPVSFSSLTSNCSMISTSA